MSQVLRDYAFLFERPGFEAGTFFKFGVMRDPIEWIVSWYRYRKGNNIKPGLSANMSFEEFWELNDWNKIFVATGKKRLQSQFFCGPDGEILVDYIIPYAELSTHFSPIARSLGVNKAIPRENTSKIKRDSVELSDDLKARMREFYAEDYAMMDRIAAINERGMRHLTDIAA